MGANFNQIKELAKQISKELKQIKERRTQREYRNYIEELSNLIENDLKQIKTRQQEREDKLCGVCYDCEATCKLDCVHSLCKYCYTKMDSCPYCRKPYRCKNNYLDILLDIEIDTNAPIFTQERNEPTRMMHSRTLGHELNKFESILDNTHDLSMLLALCSRINRMVGKHVFYREKLNDRYMYRRRLASDMSIRVAVWTTFLTTKVSKIKQEQFIDRLNHISNRIYNRLPIYAV